MVNLPTQRITLNTGVNYAGPYHGAQQIVIRNRIRVILLGVEEKDLAFQKGSVESVASKGGPRPSVASPVDDSTCTITS
uniref:IP08651p n=1 Tax=Drosophila melanogaster TaxID=7227 RepID=Q4V4C4_DROME|nr:IP08651p [Drosophila melanogaster]